MQYIPKNKAEKLVRYTNTNTGEILEKKCWVDIQFNDEGYLFWNKKSNVRTFIESPLPNEFTWAEKGRITELKHYILKDNQFLVYRSNNAIKPITDKELCNILDMSQRQCKALIKKMKQHSIIKEVSLDGIKYFAFNPIYGFKNKRLTLQVYIFFQEELNVVLPKWVIDEFLKQVKEINPNIKVIK